MAWNADRPVVEYLERRLKYYKKLVRQRKAMLEPEIRVRKNTVSLVKRKDTKVLMKIIAHYEMRVSEYQSAIEHLKTTTK